MRFWIVDKVIHHVSPSERVVERNGMQYPITTIQPNKMQYQTTRRQ